MKIQSYLIFSILLMLGCKKSKFQQDNIQKDSVSYFIDRIEVDSLLTHNEKLILLEKSYSSVKNGFGNKSELSNLAFKLYSFQKLKEFKSVSFILLEQSKKAHDSTNIALSYRFLGGYYKDALKYDSSYYYYVKAEKLYSILNKEEDYANILLNKGIVQSMINDIYGADLSFKSAYKIYHNTKNYAKSQQVLNELGLVQKKMGNYEESISYFETSLKLIDEVKLPTPYYSKSIAYNNIGLVYNLMSKFKEAGFCFEKSLDFYKKSKSIKTPLVYATALDNLALSHLNNNDLKTLPNSFYESLKIRDSLKDVSGITLSYINLSKYYNKIKDHKKSLLYANKALDLARKSRGALDILTALGQASEVDAKNTLKYSEEYITINDSLQLLERKSKDQFARIQLETDEIKQENTKLESEKDFFLNILFGIAVTGSLIVMLMLQQAKNKKLQLIKVQHDADERIYQALLEEQQKLDEARIEERKRIAREIHDDILGRLFGLRLSLDSNHTEPEITYSEDLQNIEKDLRKISHELYDKDHLINNFEASISTFIKDQEKQLKIPVKFSIDKKINWQKFSNIALINVYRIIQESYYNIAKYADATQITTYFITEENNLVVEITDDGKGFNVAKTRKGIGISNMYDRIKESKGTIEINSSPNQGTQILITIPKDTE